jgi:hypothetical protein
MSSVSNHHPERIDEANAQPEPDRRVRTARRKPERRIRVLEQPGPDTDGWAAIAITVGKQSDTYLLHTIPTDFDGALAFEVEKLDNDLATVEQYHVLLADEPKETSCECKGFLRWGRCKHADGIAALRQHKRLPALFEPYEPERSDRPRLHVVADFHPDE